MNRSLDVTDKLSATFAHGMAEAGGKGRKSPEVSTQTSHRLAASEAGAANAMGGSLSGVGSE